VVFFSNTPLLNVSVKEGKMGETYSTHEKMRLSYKIVV